MSALLIKLKELWMKLTFVKKFKIILKMLSIIFGQSDNIKFKNSKKKWKNLCSNYVNKECNVKKKNVRPSNVKKMNAESNRAKQSIKVNNFKRFWLPKRL